MEGKHSNARSSSTLPPPHYRKASNAESWGERLDSRIPEIEVLNFGVGAYGPGQAYLRYRKEAGPFHPDIVVIGFMSANIKRTVNTFRPFYSRKTQTQSAARAEMVPHRSLEVGDSGTSIPRSDLNSRPTLRADPLEGDLSCTGVLDDVPGQFRHGCGYSLPLGRREADLLCQARASQYGPGGSRLRSNPHTKSSPLQPMAL